MEVYFANNRLRRCFEDGRQAQREWNDAVAKKYIQRVQLILNTPSFVELRRIRSIRLHSLSGPLTGQYAMDLNRRWRIILTYDSAEESVRILEVTHHYGD